VTVLAEGGIERVHQLISQSELRALRRLTETPLHAAGQRELLSRPWCLALARRLLSRIACLQSMRPVQCIRFEKTTKRNWLVPPHQDVNIRSERSSQDFVTSGASQLASYIALRLHLDDCEATDGAVRAYIGSHARGILAHSAVIDATRTLPVVVQVARAGDAWLMRPLTVHASSKATGKSRRRVLHFLFAPI
jgi:Phytanoyl-CoA dioxygenase (PhyH)